MGDVELVGAYNYVAAAKKIARDLSKSGQADWGRQMLKAISSGSSETAILIGIQCALMNLKESKVAIPETMELEIAELTTKTDELLSSIPPWSHYKTAEKIAQALSKAGHPDWSNRITRAVAAGSTSGEILGELRWQLMRLQASELNVPERLKNEVGDLIGRLNSILGPLPPQMSDFKALEVCEHLAPLERYILSTGEQEIFRGKAWSDKSRIWVYFDVVLNVDALRENLALADCVKVHEHVGTHNGTELGLVCEIHNDGIMGANPKFSLARREIR